MVLLASGAPSAIVATGFGILTVHLAFQHSNLDYRVGWLRHFLGVAEIHRWHHKRDFEDAQVNFGEFLMVWDRLFGTFYDSSGELGEAEVGLHERDYPKIAWHSLGIQCVPRRKAELADKKQPELLSKEIFEVERQPFIHS
ncbi:sterol desaturase family protein [Pseudomonas sp. FP215]|uniref:sterol desaturase family protein n=1 Tax=Pseudomonas sp. FP215 TaxID=2738126 RepID=UPI0027327122|nr:sterol desaturase family protein [Pseudomonas sp. FP215]WLH26033.1 sterol desaturase family protein [Pseudomonas sp. FP215]